MVYIAVFVFITLITSPQELFTLIALDIVIIHLSEIATWANIRERNGTLLFFQIFITYFFDFLFRELLLFIGYLSGDYDGKE